MAVSGWRVLIVEDWPRVAAFEAVVVRMTGSDPTIAGDGAEALARLTDENFDLVLLDLDLPILDGLEVVERMRSHPKLCRIPIIVISTLTIRETLQNTPPVVGVLGKPFDVETLIAMMHQALTPPPQN